MQGRLRAAMVTDVGGIGDESFNASAWRGLQRAQKELGAEVRYLESRTAADYVRNLTTLARQGFDVVFAVGFLMEDALAKVAPRFPKTYFGIVDGKAPNLPNCALWNAEAAPPPHAEALLLNSFPLAYTEQARGTTQMRTTADTRVRS